MLAPIDPTALAEALAPIVTWVWLTMLVIALIGAPAFIIYQIWYLRKMIRRHKTEEAEADAEIEAARAAYRAAVDEAYAAVAAKREEALKYYDDLIAKARAREEQAARIAKAISRQFDVVGGPLSSSASKQPEEPNA